MQLDHRAVEASGWDSCGVPLALVDIDDAEHVLLLQIILGGRMIRAHDGAAYSYESYLGFWQSYNGLIAQIALKHIKTYLLRLEGFFRSHTDSLARTDDALLQSFKRIFQGKEPEAVFEQLMGNSISSKGDGVIRGLQRKGGKADGKGADAGEDDVPEEKGLAHWYIKISQTISKVSHKVQWQLLEGKLMGLFTAWCQTPKLSVQGYTCKDYQVVYLREGGFKYLKERSPDNILYLTMGGPILGCLNVARFLTVVDDDDSPSGIRNALQSVGPVLCAGVNRYMDMVSSTFWACSSGLQVQQSCEAMCKRHLNVDYMHVIMSRGRIGS